MSTATNGKAAEPISQATDIKRVYLAGKIAANDWRHSIFDHRAVMIPIAKARGFCPWEGYESRTTAVAVHPETLAQGDFPRAVPVGAHREPFGGITWAVQSRLPQSRDHRCKARAVRLSPAPPVTEVKAMHPTTPVYRETARFTTVVLIYQHS
jgi:hypothetical protein